MGYVRQAGRPEQQITITTLGDFDPEQVDMFTIVIIGNSQSYEWNGNFITPRGYYRDCGEDAQETNVGQGIMIKSFATIRKELKNPDTAPMAVLEPIAQMIFLTGNLKAS